MTLMVISQDIPNKPTPWPESVSELYRSSNRRLWGKLVPTFANTGISLSQRGGSSMAVTSDF
jgi:hypothetical protein